MSRRKVTKTCWVKGGGKRIGGVEKKSRRERTRNVITGAASNTRHEVVIREFSHSQQTWCHILDILVNSLCCNVLPRFFSFKIRLAVCGTQATQILDDRVCLKFVKCRCMSLSISQYVLGRESLQSKISDNMACLRLVER